MKAYYKHISSISADVSSMIKSGYDNTIAIVLKATMTNKK